MQDNLHSLALALIAFERLRTPGRISAALRDSGRNALEAEWRDASPGEQADADTKAAQLDAQGVQVVMMSDDDFPESLRFGKSVAAPMLFIRGNKDLLYRGGIGMCGSRDVSETGLAAAKTCGFEVSRRRLVVVSGYAKGVDTQTHLAALKTGGSTVIVLAEGFDHFRIKKEFEEDFDPERTLIVSQFAPSQPWTAFGAMARNSIIFGLGKALVVIEAGEKGGTLAAGEGALKIGRPVFVLDFGTATPAGNRKLLDAGSLPIRSPGELGEVLDTMKRDEHAVPTGKTDTLF